MEKSIKIRSFDPSSSGHRIIGFQSPQTRAINVGYLTPKNAGYAFVPCRLNLGGIRQELTFQATIQSLKLPQITNVITSFKPDEISTITVLRETLACDLPFALYKAGIKAHHGDCYIGANHIKSKRSITTNYAYENVEGLNPDGLWILADSIAEGRNLIATLKSLLAKFRPKHIILICPIANRLGVNKVSELIHTYDVDATFVVWGALFGLEPTIHYDEPWGLPDCEPIDKRDQKTFIEMYGTDLCVGGDFGNDYYCPPLALNLYKNQLKLHRIRPNIPTAAEILKIYKKEELAIV